MYYGTLACFYQLTAIDITIWAALPFVRFVWVMVTTATVYFCALAHWAYDSHI